MLLVKKDTFSLESASRLVKAADVSAVAKIDEVMKAAHDEGYDKGIQDGKMEITMQKLDLLESSVQYMESVEDKMCGIVLRRDRRRGTRGAGHEEGDARHRAQPAADHSAREYQDGASGEGQDAGHTEGLPLRQLHGGR